MSEEAVTDRIVSFVRMSDSTPEDYELVNETVATYDEGFSSRVLELFSRLRGVNFAHPVDMHEHGLQTASRALRDGADEEMTVVALLHDVGEVLCPENHAAMTAEWLRPYVSEDNYWLVRHHGLFQGYYYLHHFGKDRNARDRHRDHPMYQTTVDFCERWDQRAFDPNYDSLPLSEFEPMVHRVLSGKPRNYI